MTIEEKILLNEIKKKNKEVFELFFDQYYPVLVKFSEGYLHDIHACEDLVQTFFISFWTGSENINITTSIKSYFFTSVKNLCLNQIRDLKVRDKHEIQYIESLINIEPNEKLIDPDILSFISEAVESLPAQMSEIFRQKYFQGKQVKEIASNLDVTDGTVKTQLFRARAILRNKLIDLTKITFIF